MITRGEYVDNEFDAQGDPTAQSVNFAGTAAAGSLMIVCVIALGVDAAPGLSISDNKGNTYTLRTSATAGNNVAAIYYKANATGGAGMSFTVTPDADCQLAIAAIEFKGVKTTSPADGAAQAVAGGASAPSAGSVSVAAANDLVIGLATCLDSFILSDPGFSELANSTAFYSYAGIAIQWKLASTDTTVAWQQTVNLWLAAAASFKAQASPSAYYFG